MKIITNIILTVMLTIIPFKMVATEIPLRVFQFNIWNEANKINNGVNKIADVIAKSNADIIAFSEVRNKSGDWHQKIINKLTNQKLSYYGKFGGGDVGLISKFPIVKTEVIFDATDIDRGSLVAYYLALPNNQTIIVCSAHLDYTQFALYHARGYHGGEAGWGIMDANKDGHPDPITDVSALLEFNQSSLRDEAIKAFITFSQQAHLKDTPIILSGDFNESSHLDWTEKTKNSFGHNGIVLPWKNSINLRNANFTDAYREIFPNELTHPGLTWPSTADGVGSTSWTPKADERDRIDFIYYRGQQLQASTAFIVGPNSYFLKNKATNSTSKDPFILSELPWPSDHKGVILDFNLNF